MNYVHRIHEDRLYEAFAGPMVTAILGPRRIGKSTLIDHYMGQLTDVPMARFNMDSMIERDQVKAGKLEAMILQTLQRHFEPGRCVWVTVDEAQKCPEIFDQIKILYDRYKDQNAVKFIVTGSALLELHRLSAESLAGRIELYYLNAFGLSEAVRLKHPVEIKNSIFDLIEVVDTLDEKHWRNYCYDLLPFSEILNKMLMSLLVWGGLPEVLMAPHASAGLNYLANYLQIYLEKDVRAIESITDLPLYQQLMEICAEQTGSVRDDTKITDALRCHRETLNKYRGYLSATLMYCDIHPYINSTLKRLVKSPKGYLANNGLVSFLQGIFDEALLIKSGMIGHRLENWFLNELQIWLYKNPGHHSIHYWRTASGTEVDFVVKKSPCVYPFEVTFGQNIDPKKVRSLIRFLEYEPKARWGFYIYRGDFKYDHKNKIIFIPAWMVC